MILSSAIILKSSLGGLSSRSKKKGLALNPFRINLMICAALLLQCLSVLLLHVLAHKRE